MWDGPIGVEMANGVFYGLQWSADSELNGIPASVALRQLRRLNTSAVTSHLMAFAVAGFMVQLYQLKMLLLTARLMCCYTSACYIGLYIASETGLMTSSPTVSVCTRACQSLDAN